MTSIRQNFIRRILWLVLFAVAMGYCEAAVVIYLRAIYYPEGFSFPLKTLIPAHCFIEMGREISTLLMILAVAWFSYETLKQRLFAFMFVFGIWDIFYYVWLRVFIRWPENLATWDVLFLLPVAWLAPVLAPLIVSLILIVFAILALWRMEKGCELRACGKEKALVLLGAFIIFVSFIFEVPQLKARIPFNPYRWDVFIVGVAMSSIGLILMLSPAFARKPRV